MYRAKKGELLHGHSNYRHGKSISELSSLTSLYASAGTSTPHRRPLEHEVLVFKTLSLLPFLSFHDPGVDFDCGDKFISLAGSYFMSPRRSTQAAHTHARSGDCSAGRGEVSRGTRDEGRARVCSCRKVKVPRLGVCRVDCYIAVLGTGRIWPCHISQALRMPSHGPGSLCTSNCRGSFSGKGVSFRPLQ